MRPDRQAAAAGEERAGLPRQPRARRRTSMAAMRCVDEGIAPETIDEAALAFGMPMGPIELADTVGLDICVAVGKMLAPDAPRRREGWRRSSRRAISAARPAAASTTTRRGKPAKKPAGAIPRARRAADRSVRRRSEGGAGRRHRRRCRSGRRRRDLRHGFAPFTGGPLHYAATLRRCRRRIPSYARLRIRVRSQRARTAVASDAVPGSRPGSRGRRAR